MKKKAIALITTALSAFCLVSCQATPESNIVVGKDSERMIEQADGSGIKLSELNIPDKNYVYSVKGSDDRLSINIDAKITTPDSDYISLAKTNTKIGFSQETVTKIFNCLYPNDKSYWIKDGISSKSDIQEEILNLKRQLSENSYDTNEFSREDIEKMISNLEEQYAVASDKDSEKELSDGSMRETSKETHLGSSQGLYLNVSDTHGNKLQVYSFGEKADAISKNSLSFTTTESEGNAFSMSGAIEINDKSNIPSEINGKLSTSLDEAEEKCLNFLSAIGFDNAYSLSHAYIVNNATLSTVDNGTGDKSSPDYAYKLFFSQTYNGSHIATNVNAVSSLEEIENVSEPWEYESLLFTINDNGIIEIIWENPISIGENVVQNASLIKFEEAVDIFKTMSDTKFTPNFKLRDNSEDSAVLKTSSYDIDISEISLELINTKRQGSSNEGILTPAYVFYGHTIEKGILSGNEITVYDGDSDFPEQKAVVMAINAVDGSVINMTAGY